MVCKLLSSFSRSRAKMYPTFAVMYDQISSVSETLFSIEIADAFEKSME